jgi:replicative DNA helicase
MALELKVPVLCISQISRSCEKREDRRPILSDLKDSAVGAFERDADVVMFLYRDDYYNPDAKISLTECIVAKNRYGKIGTAQLHRNPQCGSFTEPER